MIAPVPVVTFTLGELLVDVATGSEAVPGAWGDRWHPSEDWSPAPSSVSALLGTAVPHPALLTLAGKLSASAVGMDTGLRVEVVDADRVVVACGERRFALGLAGGACTELCRQPDCERRMLETEVPWCSSHLFDLDLYSLVTAGRFWAEASHRSGEHERSSPDWPVEELMKAAVAVGAGEMMAETIVTAAFDDPHEPEQHDVPAEYGLVLRTRRAMGRERLRLWETARKEAARLRQAAGGCQGCRRELSRLEDGFGAGAYPQARPEYCSQACDPLPTARQRYLEGQQNGQARLQEDLPF
ncbi:hypothetical protein SAMN05216371_8283 [Streptomyces sp. TLI_053]|uniref:hypothetical protein n=1 Tax=Streptomyces sp. TLI_053 TaxID=1855352 RepID=UPI0008798689|nr:hypothetical protein [Streptomyces sp. TLI_053]SDT83452.1 hypothetical protein SAMN05216371_8283 [Streptomyces sp. TLI_053]